MSIATDVTVIGLGAMGSELARAFLRAGKTVTVYNRTRSKALELAKDGAVVATSVEQAIASSPVSVVNLLNYAVARALLCNDAAAAAMKGKDIVNMTGAGRPAMSPMLPILS